MSSGADSGNANKQDAADAERIRKEQQAAQEQLDDLLKQTRPKNFREGLFQGVSNIIAGAVGAVGVAIMAPTAGLAMGCESGGLCGGICGLGCGACVGACGACLLLTKGICDGITQIIRGCFAIPDAMTQPRRGKWWDENDGEWVETDLIKTKEGLAMVPDDDDDILGAARNAVKEEEVSSSGKSTTDVKETFYYDVLDVDPKAKPAKIKKQYYTLAKKYHPDRVEADDKEAADKFKDIAEAYQVLHDAELRAKYDKEGREGLSADKTAGASAMGVKMDPAMLFAFLFGSDKFAHYIGTLSTATSASIADSTKVSVSDARRLQKRRCARLALLLADRLDLYVKGDKDEAKAAWMAEAEDLVTASFGYELVVLIGQVYSVAAVQFLGSLDSGIGLPSISRWAQSYAADWKKYGDKTGAKRDTIFAGLSALQMQMKFKQAMAQATTDEERKKIEEDFQREMIASTLNVMWTTTVIDITSTLHETCQMVLFDVSVDSNKRKARGEGLKELGEIFVGIAKPESNHGSNNAEKLYEEAAFAAMLETIKRKDEAAFNASFKP